MKKVIAVIVAIMTVACGFAIAANAQATEDVYVTIANGDLKLSNQVVMVYDLDGDGVFTIDEVLYAAHEDYFKGGAAAGYASSNSDYGLMLTKLWGVENGGSYGYYVNNASAWSLADPVKEGDYVNAFVYSDLEKFSDIYCYFDQRFDHFEEPKGEYTLYGVYFDDNYTPYSAPIKNAAILVDGKKTSVKTDKNGTFSVTDLGLTERGFHTISAEGDGITLVPPALTLEYTFITIDNSDVSKDESAVSEVSEISKASEETGKVTPAEVNSTVGSPANPKSSDSSSVLAASAALVISCGALILIKKK